ncbi:NAD(P)-dependent oxidoreductase [Zunongwangia atlantica]|uniref:D-3-phosphoglycerate dehydrogenase n=1 Tax=Zunongwangia atlantica 22II14-10F7 TaxID=1185767 RepID=A0A1Y1T350_9FLAO|nr:NAD(P)-dependent oxidoreductase [Zunongwangia atlantica]ORL45015.1 D-3-phosphoglycerate dehydrogenase [Zunongwangia atlantica 22II14-10F7]
MNILVTDGLSQAAVSQLTEAGFNVLSVKVAQSQLKEYINAKNIEGIISRTTFIENEVITGAPQLKFIAVIGDEQVVSSVAEAEKNGIQFITAPVAATRSVAELVFAHILGGSRFLHHSNRNMPLEGDMNFKDLRNFYSGGIELQGKTIGIIGFGKIGQEIAKIALGFGMKVIATDPNVVGAKLQLKIQDQNIEIGLKTVNLEQVLENSDIISLSVSEQKKPIIGAKEIALMKPNSGIVNISNGNAIDEEALIEALEDAKLKFAGLDTYDNEPTPAIKLLMNERISLTPHIGGLTGAATDNAGDLIAKEIIAKFHGKSGMDFFK